VLETVLSHLKVFEKFAKNEATAFCLIKHAKNIRKIDEVLGICIKTIICKTRTWGRLSIRALPFFYLTVASF